MQHQLYAHIVTVKFAYRIRYKNIDLYMYFKSETHTNSQICLIDLHAAAAASKKLYVYDKKHSGSSARDAISWSRFRSRIVYALDTQNLLLFFCTIYTVWLHRRSATFAVHLLDIY